jgi:hypothetical protein
MCRLSELKDGTLDLIDLALANDAIDVETENTIRVREAER